MVCSVHEDKSIKILARSLSDTNINMSTVFNMAVIPDNLSICHKVIEAKVVGLLANFPGAPKFSRKWAHEVCLALNVILGFHCSGHRIGELRGCLNANDLPSSVDGLGSVGTEVLGEDHYLEVCIPSGIDKMYWDISGHLVDENF